MLYPNSRRNSVSANTPSPTNDSRPRRPSPPSYRPRRAHKSKDVDVGKRWPQSNASTPSRALRHASQAENAEILRSRRAIGRCHSGGGVTERTRSGRHPHPLHTNTLPHPRMASRLFSQVSLPLPSSSASITLRWQYSLGLWPPVYDPGALPSRTRVRRACQPTLPASRRARSCGILVDAAMAR